MVHGLATYKWVIRVASCAGAKVIAGLGCCYHTVMAEGGSRTYMGGSYIKKEESMVLNRIPWSRDLVGG